MLRHLILRENDPARSTDLTDAEAAALSTSELAIVSRSPGSAGWDVAAGVKVGAVRVGDLQVTVRPKVPVHRLVFMIGYCLRPTMWRDMPVELDESVGLPEALAQAFVHWSRRALEQGLLQGYRTVDEALPLLRGRLRVGDQISRRAGQMLPLEVTYDDFTTDITENRLILAATLRLLGMPGVLRSTRQALQRIRLLMRDIAPPERGEPLARWTPTRLNARYQPALQIADLILSGNSFEQRVGALRVSGFVLDVWRVYEDFVCVALSRAMSRFGGRSSLQQRLSLDEAGLVTLKPDFMWRGNDGRRVVVDAKYKAEKPDGFPNADVYQMLAYCTALGLSDGHLLYAKGNEESTVHRVMRSNVRVRCYALDLEAEPAALLSEIDRLATQFASVSGDRSRDLMDSF